jgi:lipopolysaccharide transport system ATP-binding protein
VEKFLDTPVKRYSSGMYVRLAFAVAAHLDPEILIVDEVLAVGDAEFQKKCIGKMKDVSAKAGRTVIFVSHNMTAITNLCDTAILLANGVLASKGPSREMVDEYVKAHLSRRLDQDTLCWDRILDAPGNDDIRVHSVLIRSSDDETILLSSEISIEISFWNLSSKNVILDFVLYTSDGSPLLEDWSADDPRWRGQKIPKGLIKTTCTIPPRLLNEGTFRMRMMFFDGDTVKPIYDFDDLVFFDVIDTADRAVGWNGKFLGPVRPKLGWTTELISEVI